MFVSCSHTHTHTHAYTNKMSEALTSAGRQLLSFDFSSGTDHIKDFEWSASYFSFSLSLFYPLFERGSSAALFQICEMRARSKRANPRLIFTQNALKVARSELRGSFLFLFDYFLLMRAASIKKIPGEEREYSTRSALAKRNIFFFFLVGG